MNIPILMYHSISNEKHQLSVSINNFEKQMKFMVNSGYETINLNDLNNIDNDFEIESYSKIKNYDESQKIITKNSYKKYFIITFDDGYEDIYLNALPILKKYNFKSVCFFVSDYIGKYNIWDESRADFIKLNLMNIDQIKNWYNEGMSVGGHTSGHKNLNKLSYNEKLDEIIGPKDFFSKNLSLNINSFSYPFGRFDKESVEIVKKNYDFAVTTKRSRFKKNKFEFFVLPRIPVNRTDNMFKFYLKIKTIYEDIKYKK